MNEQWRPIPGYRTHEVSTLGRVRVVESGRVLKVGSRRGRARVVLKNHNGFAQSFYVRLLVDRAFGESAEARTREGR